MNLINQPSAVQGKRIPIGQSQVSYRFRRWVYLGLKRLFDISVAVMVLLLMLLPMVITAILIRLDSPGNALFIQERLGKNGVPFSMYKFRSMYIDAEENGPQWAQKNDPRCTRFGRFLRSSRLDELPQLVNILKGDMSFVGPRPERACFYERFEKNVPGFSARLMVKPGLTGYAQINGGYDLKPEEKIVFDMLYIKRQSVKLDLYCLFKTIFVVFTHEGAR